MYNPLEVSVEGLCLVIDNLKEHGTERDTILMPLRVESTLHSCQMTDLAVPSTIVKADLGPVRASLTDDAGLILSAVAEDFGKWLPKEDMTAKAQFQLASAPEVRLKDSFKSHDDLFSSS